MNRRAQGTHYEEIAAAYLEAQGMQILERNFRCRSGEIDLIAADGDCLVFIEVKYRSNDHCGAPEAAVTPGKQRTIRRVAEYFLVRTGCSPDTICRFDVAAIRGDGTVCHYVNAFGGL